MADTEPIPVIRAAPEPQDYGTEAVRLAAVAALRETAVTVRLCREVLGGAAAGRPVVRWYARQLLSRLDALQGDSGWLAKVAMRLEENTAASFGAAPPAPAPPPARRGRHAAGRHGLRVIGGGPG